MASSLRQGDEFDRGRGFVATKPFRFDGRDYVPGDFFDPTGIITTRRLRQMYDARMIDVAPPSANPPAPLPEALGQLSDEDLVARLASKGIVPRPNASREWLLRKVRETTG
jgi:hypothetical protein